jgi:hypothetical protein
VGSSLKLRRERNLRSVGAQARAELLIPTKSFTLMGFLPFRLLFAFMRDILSSLIGHVARYTSSSTYNLSLPKIQKSARAN